MSALKLKVLIAGAGIAGPCLAYWLARTRLDISVKIIERSPTPRVTGQAIDIRGLAVEIIKEMGLEEAVRSRHTTEEGTRFVDSAGKIFAQFNAGDSFTADYEILRADLSQLFLEATEGLDNVRYIYGDFVESLKQTDKDINVTFSTGSNETFDMVVAADGSTSTTRPLILDPQVLNNSYKFIGQYVAFFSIPSQPTDPKQWYWYNAPKGLGIMTRPHRDPCTIGAYLCITTPARDQRDAAVEDAMAKGTSATKRMLHSYFYNAGWEAKRVLEGMDTASDFYMTRAAAVKLPKWTNGRGLVLGDAAFATFGVGTSLAIEAAYVLAGELSKVQISDDVPRALERYEEVFRPRIVKMGELPSVFPQMAFPQSAWGLWLRDSLLWIVSWTKIYNLLPGDKGVDWKLPCYDWNGSEKGVGEVLG